jgi:hypothetical protein
VSHGGLEPGLIGVGVIAIGLCGVWLGIKRPNELTRAEVVIASSLINGLLPQPVARVFWMLFGLGVCVLGAVIVVTG